jgi:multidrug efflux pump subunit AcrA (membrane-fusion protein)
MNQIEVARQRVSETSARVRQLRELIDACTIRAERAGLIVYEQNLSSNPQRKIRTGDRVTPSNGLVTIPEVRRMQVDISVREADLSRIQLGQAAVITLEAHPDARLTGKVVAIGSVAHAAPDRPFDGKRFDVVLAVDPSDVDLRPEMTAHAEIHIAKRDGALLVPVNAILDENGARVVQVVTSRGVLLRPVRLGQSNEMFVEVLDGVAEGERLRLADTNQDSRQP